MVAKPRLLDTSIETDFGKEVRRTLERRVIGQAEGVTYFVQLIDKYRSRLYDTKKPIGSALFTGPTGSGKTYLTEVFAESVQPDGILRDYTLNMMKIDCGEFQHSHEIAKLVGSPPGYLGHRETKPMLSGERLKALQDVNPDYPFAILLFDEIEKASDGLWHILLGILDKGEITLGTNERVDLTQTVVVLTSNAGFSELHNIGLGFSSTEERSPSEIARIGIEGAKRKFSMEFINRLDGVIAFHALDREAVAKILTLELGKLQFEIFSKCVPKILFRVSPAAQTALLEEGYDPKYNAREIKRVVDQRLRLPLARLLGRAAVDVSEGIVIDYKGKHPDGKFEFFAIAKPTISFITNEEGNIL